MVTGPLGVTGLLVASAVMEELEAEEGNVYHQNLVVILVKATMLKLKIVTLITVQVSPFNNTSTTA